ncbi:MAG: hypothetical protein WA029_04675, partial [Anaerolineae bacterium]
MQNIGITENLDASFVKRFNWNSEKTAWALLLILAVVTHLYMLGVRAMSHDESLHVLYSWKLYDGQG